MYKVKSGMAYITAAAVIVALWVYWISNRISVSVIVPVYNSEKFLSRCLDSIVAQKGNFEIIAVNDGSTDNSCANTFLLRGKVWQYYRHYPEKSGRVGSAQSGNGESRR